LEGGNVVIMASLDVKGAFDSAWWPALFKGLRDARCPRNLYHLAQDYLKERRAVITINSISMEKNSTKGCPQAADQDFGTYNITQFSTSVTQTTPK